MAIAYRAGAVGGTTTGTTTALSITVPASGTGGTTIAGDVAIACIADSASVTVSAAPSGWTQRAITTNAQSNITAMIYTKTLVSGDISAAAAWTMSSGGEIAASIDVVSGADESSFTYSTMAVGTGTTVTSPTITVAAGGFAFGFWAGATTTGGPFTFTKDATYTAASTRATAVVSGANRTMGTAFISASGSTVGVGCTFSASTARNAVFAVNLAPTPVPVTLTGDSPPDVTLAPLAGSVSTAMGGAVASLLLSPFAGAFSLGGGAAGDSPPGFAVAPLAGSVSAAVRLSGPVAGIAIAPLSGVVALSAILAGPVVGVSIGAPAGTFGTGISVTLGGPVADLAIAGVGGQVVAQRPVTLSGTVAPLVVAPVAGAVSTGALMEGINAVLLLAALNGDVTGGFGATVSGPTATLSLTALHGFAGQLRDISVSLRAMSDDWSATEPTDSNQWKANAPLNNSWQAGEVSR